MKIQYKIMIGIGICYLFILTLLYFGYRNNRNSLSNPVKNQMFNSQVLEEKLGKIKKIRNKAFSFPKSVGKQGKLEYIVKTNEGNYRVTAIVDVIDQKFIVDKYIIDGEEIYEKKN